MSGVSARSCIMKRETVDILKRKLFHKCLAMEQLYPCVLSNSVDILYCLCHHISVGENYEAFFTKHKALTLVTRGEPMHFVDP